MKMDTPTNFSVTHDLISVMIACVLNRTRLSQTLAINARIQVFLYTKQLYELLEIPTSLPTSSCLCASVSVLGQKCSK